MKSSRITFPFSARYTTTRDLSPQITEIVYVIHGYGQLSEFFIKKFASIDTPDRVICAPEGLSRFYLKDFKGRIGATWMTREDRETDISNYVNYLNTIHDALSLQASNNLRITVVGFSQGAATATRWLMDNHIQASRLILWAGILPYDLDVSNAVNLLRDTDLTCVYGSEDPYLSDDKKKEMTDLTSRTGLSFNYITFQGGHDIHEPTLKKLFP